ncbi:PQQ-dependent sugar dehydrogenase [Ohtaekwangia koreensis]|uniref:Glucose/arabinose dehydrogenase, beta-propeller fold n=1 Tax=Ohtaekwangia koreensis TaxID=688867 RepID=A0A1T5K877_9BACT|nr:sorbosone dehydrogenase family protein [Ohtaekwangia koreensis]SKC59669.1 Glucose/arabinose dehydrogenase, beta-propeller fold [Ohtaekwangia koreensis]
MRSIISTPVLMLGLMLACSNSSSTDPTGDKGVNGRDVSAPAITDYAATLPLDKIKLPAGFKIAVYAEVENARSMALSPSGVVYVGNRDKDKVYAVKDTNGDFIADKKWVIASGLNMPNGVAFKDGNLYVAEISKITKYTGIESKLDNPPAPTVIADNYPTESHHGWKFIAFGPDGKLYVPVGAPCNICESKDEIYASITRLNADGSGREVFARGVRNTVGFTWHPQTKELWFTDNGRDMLGDDKPSCELNVAPKKGMHFGYPYCHEGSIKDPEFGDKHPCSEFTAPADKLGPHVAPLGLRFYTGSSFPVAYKNQIFVAEHGSWNRSKKSGYNVTLVKLQNNKVTSHELFASGWLDEATQKEWGRPVDVLVLPDGSMLVSDDKANVIYRISYKG